MPHAPDAPPEGVDWAAFAHQDPRTLRPHLEWADAVIAQPQWPAVTRELARSGCRLIFDLYVPEPFELLEAHAGKRAGVRRAHQELALDRLADAARVGHHLICASERQRDLWVGFLLASRVLGPEIYSRAPDLRSVIDVVPLGVPSSPPAPGPALEIEGPIVLWNGGIYPWFDAESVIRAMPLVRDDARLVFMGRGRHEAAVRATASAEALVASLGLGERVVFNDAWVPYGERGAWLLQADCAVSAHVDHLETRFAVRTRLMDCLWAGLPMVCTEGDELAARVAAEGLGVTVPERDPTAIAAGIETVLARGRDAYAEAMARVAAEFEWSRVVGPIVAWLTGSALPPRIGAARRPAHALRDGAYVAARGALNAVGLRRWPGG
jgi:glycosyltransferase involved in cell wall biosynthesis